MQHLAVWQPVPPLGLPGLTPGILSTPGRQQRPFSPPAVERGFPDLELQGRGFWQVQSPELEVVQGSGFNTLALDVGGHQTIRAQGSVLCPVLPVTTLTQASTLAAVY